MSKQKTRGEWRKEALKGWPNDNTRLSPHFTLGEFRCHSPKREPVPKDHVKALVDFCHDILEPLREEFGACEVESGFRPEYWNQAQGGASQSWHIYYKHPGQVGGDFNFAKGNVTQWRARAIELGAGGVGTYGDHIHIDTGPRRDWHGL